MSKYFNLENDNQQSFLVPKTLIHDERYKSLNSSAVILYAVLLDEMLSKSVRNGWVDDAGSLYVLYPTQKMIDLLNVSTSKLSRIKQQLIAHDLIEISKRNIGEYDKIYIKK